MALPDEFREERTKYLEQEANKYQLHELGNLTDEDFVLLGKYIQMYCFIELNLHRLFNKLESTGILKTKPKGKMSTPYILSELINIENMNIINPSIVNEVKAKLIEIQFRRDYRNIFAHWAAKRIPNEDAMIFFAGDAQDFKKIFKKKINPDTVAYAIFDVADIRGLIAHMNVYEEWIAHFYAEIYEQQKNPSNN